MAHGLEQANAMTKSSRRNQVDEPQIFPGCSAHVEETERMSTPTEERGDLQIRNIWKHQADCILDVRTYVSRILIHQPTLIGNRKQP